MLAKTLKRAGLGFLIGIAAGNVISYLISSGGLISQDFVEFIGDKSAAMFIQQLLMGIDGAVCFGGMSFYDIESWGMARAMITHFFVIAAVYIPIALFLRWFTSALPLVIMLCAMAAAYIIVWVILQAVYKAQVKDLNRLNDLNDLNNANNDTTN